MNIQCFYESIEITVLIHLCGHLCLCLSFPVFVIRHSRGANISGESSQKTARSLSSSFHSEKSVSKYGGDENGRATSISLSRLYSLARPDWVYGILGTIGAFIVGAQMPFFAIGVTEALVSYYMDWDTTRREIKKISLLFCGGGVLTLIVHGLTYLCFGIMGERLTLRLRKKMFKGMFIITITAMLIVIPLN